MKTRLCMMLALLALVLFSGNAAAADQTITIQMGNVWSGDINALWNGIARDYEKANPGVKIEFVTETWPGTQQLVTWAAAGVLPDVFYVLDNDVPSLAAAGVLADITPLVQQVSG